MIIEIDKLKQIGGSADFEFNYNAPDDLLSSLQNAEFSGGVKVFVHAELNGSDLFADIVIDYRIKGECARCLDIAFADVNYPLSAKFSLCPDEDEFVYKGGKVDLHKCIDEAILLSLPTVMYCKEDCKGLCPVCGANLNKRDCGHNINK